MWLFGALALGGVVAAFLLPPLRQPESYHHFADARTLAGIPNALNVVSNAGFLVVGLMGLGFLVGRDHFTDPRERAAYVVFFLGVCGACFGSSYYHWAPRDATLAWDRLPMILAFMSLLSATMAERISVTAGARLLWPLLAAQYLSIFLIGWLLVFFPPSYTRNGDLLAVAGFYVLAKIAEAMDERIYALTKGISGHTLKHLIAAVAVYWVLRMLRKRAPRSAMAHIAASSRPKLPIF